MMPKITGFLRTLPGQWFPRQHPDNLPLIAVDVVSGRVVAQSTLGPYDDFEFVIADETPLSIEIRVALPGVAPLIVDVDELDVEVELNYDNNQNSRL